MKILVIDQIGLALDFCMQCEESGHDVRLWVKPKKGKTRSAVGDGFVRKVPDWKPHMAWADLIVTTDNSSMMEDLAPFQKRGFPIFGSNVAGAELELNRQKGQDLFKKVGMKVMEGVEFKDYDKAIEYVKKNMERFVSKPNGDVDKALSYVSKSPADMVFMLERWKAKNPKNEGFILQKFQGGIEMAVGGWFGKNGWSRHFLENFEHKKLMAGDNGVNTGEQGTCMRYTEKSQLAEELLLPLTDHLKKINYRGFFDMACIIDKEGTPWPLEATSRPGWPCNIIQSALIVSDPAEWMLDALEGRDTLQVANEVATGVVVAIPDYPFTEYTGRDVEGFPVYHSEPMWMEDIHLCDVKLGKAPVEEDGEIVEKPMPVTTGDYVCVATGTDFTVSGSANRAYRAIKKIEIPNSPMWRIDIGKRLEKQLPELQDLGFAEGWEY
jgi:phosphoribosylamine--glycine ligase